MRLWPHTRGHTRKERDPPRSSSYALPRKHGHALKAPSDCTKPTPGLGCPKPAPDSTNGRHGFSHVDAAATAAAVAAGLLWSARGGFRPLDKSALFAPAPRPLPRPLPLAPPRPLGRAAVVA